jgi:hypothetical protein
LPEALAVVSEQLASLQDDERDRWPECRCAMGFTRWYTEFQNSPAEYAATEPKPRGRERLPRRAKLPQPKSAPPEPQQPPKPLSVVGRKLRDPDTGRICEVTATKFDEQHRKTVASFVSLKPDSSGKLVPDGEVDAFATEKEVRSWVEDFAREQPSHWVRAACCSGLELV